MARDNAATRDKGSILGGVFMEQPENSATAATPSDKVRREDRNVWVLTAYGIAGLTLFGVLVYYFSSYITQ